MGEEGVALTPRSSVRTTRIHECAQQCACAQKVCVFVSSIADAECWAGTQRVRGQKMPMEVQHTRVRVIRVTFVLRVASRAA